MTQLQYTHVVYPANYTPKEDRAISILDVYDAVSHYCKIDDMGIKSRKKELVYARHLYCFISRKRTLASLVTVASLVGARDHTTIVHAVQTLQNWYDTDENVRIDVANIMDLLNKRA